MNQYPALSLSVAICRNEEFMTSSPFSCLSLNVETDAQLHSGCGPVQLSRSHGVAHPPHGQGPEQHGRTGFPAGSGIGREPPVVLHGHMQEQRTSIKTRLCRMLYWNGPQ